MSERMRGIAEMTVVHRDKDGRVKSEDHVKTPVTYRLDNDGQPADIQPEG